MKCCRKKVGMQTLIDVDGKTVYPSAYMTYCMEKENIDTFKKNGIKMFMFPVYAGDEGINMESGLRPFCDNFFKGYGIYDFSVVDSMLEMIAADGTEEVYIIPRVCVEPPKWWQELHPEEVARDFRGEPQRECFASVKWREDMMEAVKALIDHIEGSKWKNQVIGYHIAAGGTEEWAYHSRYSEQYYDYSEPNLKAYKNFLKVKYNTVEALSLAWHQKIESWEKVTFPTPIERRYAQEGFVRNPEKEQHVLDYFDFHNESVAETIIYFCRQIKEYTKGDRLTGAFYGYVFSMPQNKKGLHAMRILVSSPYIDFISTTNDGKGEGEAWCFSSAVHSVLLHDKMWICEGDIRTCMTTSLQEKLPHATPDNDYYGSAVWVGPATMELSCSALTKAIARTLTAPCGIWWFDMFGGWFNDPAMIEVIKHMEGLLMQQKHNYLKTEIAVIIDEKGHKFSGIKDREMAAGMHELKSNLSHLGAPFHNYLMSDLVRDDFPVESYKLYIFVAATNPLDAEKEAICQKLKQNGRTLLWLHTGSCYDSKLSEFDLEQRMDDYTEKAEFEGRIYPVKDFPVWNFKDEKGYVLSRFTESKKPAVIWKKREDYNIVYSLHLAPPAELLRHIALLSGMHLFNLSGDCVFAGGEFVALHAVEAGYRRINLPESGFKATNALTGEAVTVNDMFIDLKLNQYDTVVIHIEKDMTYNKILK